MLELNTLTDWLASKGYFVTEVGNRSSRWLAEVDQCPELTKEFATRKEAVLHLVLELPEEVL